jgi:DNA-directed RNA polymerase specialized sigma24 family protein
VNVAGTSDGGFEAFCREQYAALAGWLTARGADPADAADAAQEAFTQVWRHWPQVANRRGYLYRVAEHELGKVWHARRREAARSLVGGLASREVPGGVPARLQAVIVRQHLLALPGRQREVLAGCYDGYQDAELAVALGMPAATIRSHRRHARASLRRLAEVLEQDPRGLMLRRAYADMRDGDPCPAGARPVIARSWTRSAQQLADPGCGPALPPLTGEELALRRSASPLAGICPAVCASLASATGLLTVVSDAEGRVLWRAGDRKDLRRGEDDGHGDGACLAEHAVGTCGVSLALAASHPVVVCGAEHYCPEQHDLVCAGAPVRDPRDGQLLGAVCLSAPWPGAHPDMLKLIDQTARRIQRQLPSTASAARSLLDPVASRENQQLAIGARWPGDSLVRLDVRGDQLQPSAVGGQAAVPGVYFVEPVAEVSVDLDQDAARGHERCLLGGGIAVPARGAAFGADPVELGAGLLDVPVVEGHGVSQVAGASPDRLPSRASCTCTWIVAPCTRAASNKVPSIPAAHSGRSRGIWLCQRRAVSS